MFDLSLEMLRVVEDAAIASARTMGMGNAKAADQGDAEAQVELGLMLAQGQGGKVDLADAVAWFRKAAEAGYSPGQYNLGYAYCTGQDVGVLERRG